MMLLVLVVPLMIIVRLGPLRLPNRVRRELVKRLAQKLRAGKTEMHPFAVAAGLRHRSDPAVALHLVGVLVTLAARAESHDQARHQSGASARQRGKYRCF